MYCNYVITYLFVILLLFTSCIKSNEMIATAKEIPAELVFQDEATAITALTTIYAFMVDGKADSYLTCLHTGLRTDELANPTDQDTKQMFRNQIEAGANETSREYWKDAYKHIYDANRVYKGCEAPSPLPASVRKQLQAEALFIRAFWHFYLVNLWGDVPLVLTPDFERSRYVKRTSIRQVYEQIEADLTVAKNDLSDFYLDKKSMNVSVERVRPNKAAATALLARLYLYWGKYKEAEQMSTLLIEDREHFALVPLENVFTVNSKETVFSLSPPFPNQTRLNTKEGSKFILIGSPILFENPILSTQLLSAFETGDRRKDVWVGKFVESVSGPEKAFYFARKYKVKYSVNVTEYTVVLRLAEQYLIRAEARAALGMFRGALSDLNMVRARAGLPPYKDENLQLTTAEFQKLILKERQVEFFTEWGHRLLDLKRTKTIDEVMARVAPLKGGVWKTEMQYLPIPQRDINLNRNLVQNAGY